MLRAQLVLVEQGMGVLNGWAHGEVAIDDAVAELRGVAEAEHVARRELHHAVRDSFSTPIEAEDLFELGERLGEITEAGYALIRESELSRSGETGLAPDPFLVELLDALAAAVVPLSEALRALPGAAAATYADRAIEALSAAEHAYRAAVADLENEPDVRRELRRRELYRRAEHLHAAILRVARRTGYSVYKSR
ncbi:phosphate transport regulator-like protein [Rhodococcus wratislaviensis IFP 2016]|nr:phosphate transport regulator-like protein [Rhodococcus wratislaviensis IFP 2016]